LNHNGLTPIECANFDTKQIKASMMLEDVFKTAMSSGVAKLRVVKSILTGPPGAGKSTLKKRLLNEELTNTNTSTGVADAAIRVDSFRKLNQEGAAVIGRERSSTKWTKQSLDEEAVLIRNQSLSDQPLATETKQFQSSSTQLDTTNQPSCLSLNETTSDNEDTSSTMDYHDDEESSLIEQMEEHITMTNSTIGSDNITSTSNVNIPNEETKLESAKVKKSAEAMTDTVQKIPVTRRRGYEKKYNVGTDCHSILHIIDTGGQPEFHEILPALITGPAINLLVFKLTESLDKRCEIIYRTPSGHSVPYETSFTHEEVIFRSLASIACLRQNTIGWPFAEAPIKDNSKPAAFIIGTHKDCLKDRAKATTAQLNEQLKLKIESSGELFNESSNLIQFSDEDQVIYSMDTVNDEEVIEELRSRLHDVISNNFEELEIPISWCNLSIRLRKSKRKIFNFYACYKLAVECGITDKVEFHKALWYLHHRAGTLMYYPEVEGLKDVIITDLQLLFDRITELISSCFTFKEAGKNQAVDNFFRSKGQFTEKTLKELSTKKARDPLTFVRLVSLLKHLHIIAGPMEDHKTKEKYYFMPCALKPTTIENIPVESIRLSSLLIWFECGYIPIGVYCCLIVYLLGESKWALVDKCTHHRNQITFKVGRQSNRVTIFSHATFLQVHVVEPVSDSIIDTLCGDIVSTLDKGLDKVTQSLHYTHKSKHMFGFPCNCHQADINGLHPAVIHDDKEVAECIQTDDVLTVTPNHSYWMDKILKIYETKTDSSGLHECNVSKRPRELSVDDESIPLKSMKVSDDVESHDRDMSIGERGKKRKHPDNHPSTSKKPNCSS
jgi:ankyrin